jgi:hypothetical protein
MAKMKEIGKVYDLRHGFIVPLLFRFLDWGYKVSPNVDMRYEEAAILKVVPNSDVEVPVGYAIPGVPIKEGVRLCVWDEGLIKLLSERDDLAR